MTAVGACRREDAADDLLRGRLAVGTGHTDARHRRKPAHPARGPGPAARPGCPGRRRCRARVPAASAASSSRRRAACVVGDQECGRARPAAAAARNSCPSVRSPGRATKRPPARHGARITRHRHRSPASTRGRATTAPPLSAHERRRRSRLPCFAGGHHWAGPPSAAGRPSGRCAACRRVTAEGSAGTRPRAAAFSATLSGEVS